MQGALVAFCVSILLVVALGATQERTLPHIVYILADDVGWADVCFGREDCPIATPELDKLAANGRRLSQFYAHSTCTPSRASLMTGRYSANTGLNFPLMPGSIGGIPENMVTLPEVLRGQGYDTHMVGKWHIGHARWSQTPVGRGFQSHVGSYLWSMDYDSKELWELPWVHFCVDWVRAFENGTYLHYAEPRHSTEALTEEAIGVIQRQPKDNPLFLYLAYTAAHAPLQPLPEDEAACQHLSHIWRRKYCGLVKGLDRSVGKIVDAIKENLGDNVLLAFSSDNGGAPWFGGLNYPLRSGKTMPFEGGVRVPAFYYDFGNDSKYIGKDFVGREYEGMMHISDWLPTLASIAGVDKSEMEKHRFDGRDQSLALKGEQRDSPREDMLIEMYYYSKGEFLFPEDIVAYRRGKYKLIESVGLRDGNWYLEPHNADQLNSTDTRWTTWLGEKIIRTFEGFTTAGKFDSLRDLIVHIGVHALFRTDTPGTGSPSIMLFDIEHDPEERNNIAKEYPQVVAVLRAHVQRIMEKRPKQQQWWMTIDRDAHWKQTLKTGDCAQNTFIDPNNCLFTHPWIPDDVSLTEVEKDLVHGAEAWPFIRKILVYMFYQTAIPALLLAILVISACLLCFWNKQKSLTPREKEE